MYAFIYVPPPHPPPPPTPLSLSLSLRSVWQYIGNYAINLSVCLDSFHLSAFLPVSLSQSLCPSRGQPGKLPAYIIWKKCAFTVLITSAGLVGQYEGTCWNGAERVGLMWESNLQPMDLSLETRSRTSSNRRSFCEHATILLPFQQWGDHPQPGWSPVGG